MQTEHIGCVRIARESASNAADRRRERERRLIRGAMAVLGRRRWQGVSLEERRRLGRERARQRWARQRLLEAVDAAVRQGSLAPLRAALGEAARPRSSP